MKLKQQQMKKRKKKKNKELEFPTILLLMGFATILKMDSLSIPKPKLSKEDIDEALRALKSLGEKEGAAVTTNVDDDIVNLDSDQLYDNTESINNLKIDNRQNRARIKDLNIQLFVVKLLGIAWLTIETIKYIVN